ncbi:MAG: hypothetical protein JW774_06825 [Candidatus Aureabacteria bacterium]|nr:hypothetical protein [Candidatus Auribacterota bacterium]
MNVPINIFEKSLSWIKQAKKGVVSQIHVRKLKKALSPLQEKWNASLTELGRAYVQANRHQIDDFKKWHIPSLLSQNDFIEDQIIKQEQILDQQKEQLKVKAETLRKTIKKKSQDLKAKKIRCEVANRDQFYENKIKKVEKSITETEKRKKRAQEYRTFAPIPLLENEKSKLKRQFEHLREILFRKEQNVSMMTRELKEANEEVNRLSVELNEYLKEMESLNSNDNITIKKIKELKKKKSAFQEALDQAFFQLGQFLQEKVECPDSLQPLIKKIDLIKNEMNTLTTQMGSLLE